MSGKETSKLIVISLVVVLFVFVAPCLIATMSGVFLVRQVEREQQRQVADNLKEIRDALARYHADTEQHPPREVIDPTAQKALVTCQIRPSGKDGCRLELTFTNPTSAPIPAAKYQLLLEEPGFAPLEVQRDGIAIAYTGKLIKRDAAAITTVMLPPGESITSSYDVCENYDLDDGTVGVQVRYRADWPRGEGLEEVLSDWVTLSRSVPASE